MAAPGGKLVRTAPRPGPRGAGPALRPPRRPRVPVLRPRPPPAPAAAPGPHRLPTPVPFSRPHPGPSARPRLPPSVPTPVAVRFPRPSGPPRPLPGPGRTSPPPNGPLSFPQEDLRLALLGAQAEEPPPRRPLRRLLAFPGLLHRTHICRHPETAGRAAARGSSPWPPGLSAPTTPPPACRPPGLAPAQRRTRNRLRRRRRCQQTSRIPQLILRRGPRRPRPAIGWRRRPPSAAAREDPGAATGVGVWGLAERAQTGG